MISGIRTVGMPSMAKRTGMRKHVSETRFGEKSAADLRLAVERLRELANEMEEYAEAMESHKIKNVRTDGAEQIKNGLELVANFTNHLNTAIRKATQPKLG